MTISVIVGWRAAVAVASGTGVDVDFSSVFCLLRGAFTAAVSPSFLTLGSRGFRVFFSLTGSPFFSSSAFCSLVFLCLFTFGAASAVVVVGGAPLFVLCAAALWTEEAEGAATTPSPSADKAAVWGRRRATLISSAGFCGGVKGGLEMLELSLAPSSSTGRGGMLIAHNTRRKNRQADDELQ